MNSSLNRSGHSELRDPEWFECSSAKLAPNNNAADENEASLFQNSITSLNLDRSIAEMDLFASVRSLPIFLSSNSAAAAGATSGNRSIANLQDAPWNQSPQSLRSSLSPRRKWKGGMRSNSSSNRNETSSFMDELQNSLSEITSGVYPTVIVPQQITTLEETDDLLLESSLMSLRVADLQPYEEDDEEAEDGERVEQERNEPPESSSSVPKQQTSASDMDVTAHAGNVSHSVLNHRPGDLDGVTSFNGQGFPSTSFRQQQQNPSRPSRVQSFNHHHGYQNNNNNTNRASGVVSRVSSWNPRTMGAAANHQPMSSSNMSYGSRTGNTFNNNYSNNHNSYNFNNEPSMSTLGDGDDDDDDDDDNQEIIRMLRNQVNTLKQQLLEEQNKNQLQKQQLQNSRQSLVSNTSDEDSFGEEDDSSFGGGGGGSSSRQDLGGGEKATTSLANDTPNVNNNKNTIGHSSSSSKHQILASLATLKASILNKQRHPHQHPHDDDASQKEEEDEQQALMDELVVCELEQQFRTLCQMHTRQLHRQAQEHEEAMAAARSRIAALETQIRVSQTPLPQSPSPLQ